VSLEWVCSLGIVELQGLCPVISRRLISVWRRARNCGGNGASWMLIISGLHMQRRGTEPLFGKEDHILDMLCRKRKGVKYLCAV